MLKSRNGNPAPTLPKSSSSARLPYPDGWFAVAFSKEIRPGQVTRRRFMGEDVVLYRTRRGELHVVQPYCPHLGAHLGIGGKVKGEDLVCPFHGFAFGPDGMCNETGYGLNPPRAQLQQWLAREVNGLVVLWHHAQGALPTWEIPAAPTEDDDYPPAATHTTTMVTHPQEVVENAIDIGHFSIIHGTSGAQITKEMELDGPRLAIGTAVWRTLPLLGRSDVTFDVKAHGLGYMHVKAVIPQMNISAVVQIMPVAIDQNLIEGRFTVSARFGSSVRRATRYANWLATQIFAQPSWRGITQDAPIWKNKVHVARPRLAPGDGPIVRFRGWADQFYSGG